MAHPSKKKRHGCPKTLRVPAPDGIPHAPARLIPADMAAELTGRSARTVDRWRASRVDDPACLAVLQAHVHGLLPHPAWQDWRMDPDGGLSHRAGPHALTGFRPADLLRYAEAFQQARDAVRELTHLRAQVALLAAALEQARQPAEPGLPAAANDDAWCTPQLGLAL